MNEAVSVDWGVVVAIAFMIVCILTLVGLFIWAAVGWQEELNKYKQELNEWEKELDEWRQKFKK